MAMERFDPDDPEAMRRLQSMFGPQQVDQQIRTAIHFCWMALPPDKQNVEGVEQEIRRLVNRALKDMREDADRFMSGDD